MMIMDEWMKEARRYAEHAYCYGSMVDEFSEHFTAEFAHGVDPYKAVDDFSDDADLDRADGLYGINSGKEFIKLWKPGNPEDAE